MITPLNVRDPSALVMGPGAAQQPPTNSALPATPPASSSRSDSDLKDALAASARGIGAAAKKASLPVPKVALGGSGLRGLGVAGGGSSASASLGPISAGNVPNRSAGGDSTGNVRSTKGYSGVARGQTSGGGGMEALKAAADKQTDNMNRGTGAATDLNAAAQTAIPSGGGGGAGGGPGGGKEDKGFGGNQDKGSKSVGESLAFINKKARMEKDLELEYKKKELDDWGLLWSQMRNEGLKTLMTEMVKGAIGVAGGNIKDALERAGPKQMYVCSSNGFTAAPDKVSPAASEKCMTAYQLDGAKNLRACSGQRAVDPVLGADCNQKTMADDGSKGNGQGQVADRTDGALGETLGKYSGVDGITEACNLYETLVPKAGAAAAPASGGVKTEATYQGGEKSYLDSVKSALDAIAKARVQLTGKATCGFQPTETLDAYRRYVIAGISNGAKTLRGNGVVNAGADASKDSTKSAADDISEARTKFNASQALIVSAANSAAAAVITPPTGTVGQQYLTLNEKATTAKTQIGALAEDLKADPQAKLEAVLKRAEATAVGDNASIAKVVDVNDRFVAMTEGITEVNKIQETAKKPTIIPPEVKPVGDSAKDLKAEPKTVVDNAANADKAIQEACGQVGLGQVCKTPPTNPIEETALVDVKVKMEALPTAVTAARQSQVDVLAGIAADITAISKTAGGPALMGQQSRSLGLSDLKQ
ncbi:MAG: hypothetical protein A2V88_15000 [Elusimicrobia bacterium RBG_16_66_12]|nr:MAG: hypothetical protein A2V88_15000 [Elusimicrobia bacterium RBG_16_66_12]